jgi:hypothetical protein
MSELGDGPFHTGQPVSVAESDGPRGARSRVQPGSTEWIGLD